MSAPLYDTDQARARIQKLEREAAVHEEKGLAILAGEARRTAVLLRHLWGIPGGGGP